MRVMQAIFTPRHSGAEVLACDLAEYFTNQGAEVAVCALNPPEAGFLRRIESLESSGVQWFYPSRPSDGWLRRSVLFARYFRKFKPDIILSHSELPSLYARVASMSVPVVTVLHSGSLEFHDTAVRLAEKLLTYRTSAVIGVTHRNIFNYTQRVRRHPRMYVIRNGIHLDRFIACAARRTAIRASFGLSDSDVVAVQIGRIFPTKQQHMTLKAIRLLQQGGLSGQRITRLWYAGLVEDSKYYERLNDQARGLTDTQVEFLGPREDIPELLAASDVFIMPSLHEAQSIALLEALASGVAIVASSISAFRFAEQYSGVWLCPPDNENALMELIGKAVASERRKRYVRDLKEFDFANTGRAYAEVICKITHVRKMDDAAASKVGARL